MKKILYEFYSQEKPEEDVNYGKEQGYMAKRNLQLLVDYANQLLQTLDEGEELPEWVESEIAKASEAVHKCFHYIEYK